MSQTPRCSLDSRYEREPEPQGGPAPAMSPVPYSPQQAVSVGVPGTSATVFTSPTTVTTGANVLPGAIISQSPAVVMPQPLWTAMGGITVINNPPAAGSPCPVCGKALGEAGGGKHEHHGPAAAPRFSKATPEVFREGFKPLWDAAQAEQAAYVVVSGCNKLMNILLQELESKAVADRSDREDRPRASGGGLFGWGRIEEKKPTFADRIEKLQKKGYLLKSTVAAARDSGMAEVLTEKIDAGAVTHDMAKRYVQLLWQVADQGFEQPGWSQTGQFPKAVAGPADPHALPAPQASHAGGHPQGGDHH